VAAVALKKMVPMAQTQYLAVLQPLVEVTVALILVLAMAAPVAEGIINNMMAEAVEDLKELEQQVKVTMALTVVYLVALMLVAVEVKELLRLDEMEEAEVLFSE
jgi:hypothetical protein